MRRLLLLLLSGFVQTGYAQEAPGLILQYKMDASCELIDEAASPSNGVLVDITPAPNANNTANTSLGFNAATSYITLGAVDKLKLAGDKTITFWVKPVIINAARTGSIFRYGTGMVIGYQEIASAARLNISFGGTLYMQVPLTANEWQAVTISFAKNFSSTESKAVAYINGLHHSDAVRTKTNQDFTNALALMGPASQTSLTNGFRGSLDELKMYDRALTSSEVLMAVLPAKLERFTAKRVNGVVELYWKTSTEDNVSHFDIQKSSDGINFETVNKIFAGKYVYIAYEANTSKQDTWYRLQIVDKDGKNEYSPIVKVGPDTGAEDSIIIYPNPGTETIHINGILNSYKISVVSAMGAIVRRQSGNKVDIADLRPGLYYIIIYDDNGNKKRISKFIKR